MFPNRQSIRLPKYDYSQNGMYFVTVCTQNRAEIFGQIVGVWHDASASMELNEYGQIVKSIWESLPNHHPVELDAFQIMPNHIHFILGLSGGSRPNESGGSRPNESGGSRPNESGGSRPAPTVGMMVGFLKSESSKQIHQLANNPKLSIWQRNFYEHIVRNDIELFKIREYIENNPQMWDQDRNNLNFRV